MSIIEIDMLVEAFYWMQELKYVWVNSRDSGDRRLLELIADINKIELLLAQPEPVVTGLSNKQTPHYDMSIHSNPSAMAWTKFFRECWPECNLDDETMLGWFANAMMAMHDHIYQTSPPNREPLSEQSIWTANTEQTFEEGVRWAEKQHGIGE